MIRNVSAQKTALLWLASICYVMIVVDISVVFTAMPAIQLDLSLTPAELSWVHSAYTLTFGGFLLLGAKLGDTWGRKLALLMGIALFVLGSIVIGLSVGPMTMFSGRVLQGFGAALLAPATLALLSSHFSEGTERTRALSIHAAAAGAGTSMGLVLGGLVAGLYSWRACFFINLPIGLALMWLTIRFVPESAKRKLDLDFRGAMLSTSSMLLLVHGMLRSTSSGLVDLEVLSCVFLSVILLWVFIGLEAQIDNPIVPLHLFSSPERNAAYVCRVLFMGAIVGFWFFTTQFLQRDLGYSPLKAGLAFVPTTVLHFSASLLVPKLAHIWSSPKVLGVGLGICAFSLCWMSYAASAHQTIESVAGPMILVGISQGLIFAPLTSAGVSGVLPDDAGAASGLVNVAHQLGGAVGLSVLVMVFSRFSEHGLESMSDTANGMRAAYFAAGLMLIVALIVSKLFIDKSVTNAGDLSL